MHEGPFQQADERPPLDRRLQAYSRLSRALFPRGYTGKLLLLAFVATHVPLLTLLVYVTFAWGIDSGDAWRILLVALMATLAGTTMALVGIWVLLAPVASASQALAAYRESGVVHTFAMDVQDEGGRLLADVERTILHLDQAIARLEQLASRDSLTGLLNRREAEERIRAELVRGAVARDRHALVIIDVDGLKQTNDRWGHAAGDLCIRHIAATLEKFAPDSSIVGRWGGDEFIVLVRAESGEAEILLSRINAALAGSPVRFPNGETATLRVSGGVVGVDLGKELDDVIESADRKLYRTKCMRGEGAGPVSGHTAGISEW